MSMPGRPKGDYRSAEHEGSPMSTPLLEVVDLHAGYGLTRVLHGMDFDVRQGGITTILGANGAGKTTTLRAVSGTVRRSGKIAFGGKSIVRTAPEAVNRRTVSRRRSATSCAVPSQPTMRKQGRRTPRAVR